MLTRPVPTRPAVLPVIVTTTTAAAALVAVTATATAAAEPTVRRAEALLRSVMTVAVRRSAWSV